MIYRLILTAAAVCGLNVTSYAADDNRAIVVVAAPITFARWSGNVTRRIENNLTYPTVFGKLDPTGIVSVAFSCSEEGLPTTVSLYRTSGNRGLDRAAMRAVRQIKTLHPMPKAFRSNQKFVANILFATSQDNFDKQVRLLRSDASRRNAGHTGDGQLITLNIGSRPQTGL
jgi:TonB family protein